jgi:DNA excision repair protein ERCC-3
MDPLNPLIIQSDLEILVEVANAKYEEARDAIAPFTELVKSPEHLHTYRISHLSLWNAAAAGLTTSEILTRLENYSKFPIPPSVSHEVEEIASRWGKIKLEERKEKLILFGEDELLMKEISMLKGVRELIEVELNNFEFEISKNMRGVLKSTLIEHGFPLEDLAGYVSGEPLEIKLRDTLSTNGKEFILRDYQKEASQVFYASGGPKGGSGVIVLPCGAGKTVVGISAMALAQTKTLVLSPNIVAGRQWIREILDKTELREDQVKEYSGERKEIGDVTVATYQIITKKKGDTFSHFHIFQKNKWGLIIYDEVHLLPAPVFRSCAEVQATRRLGLTATLVREDGREKEVFSLIGPKKYDLPWKNLETQGWIATARCMEIRIDIPQDERIHYAVAPMREKIKLAATSKHKNKVVQALLTSHDQDNDRVLIIGQYISQLEGLAATLDIPLVTGKTRNSKRELLFKQFRTGELKHLMVSKVGNFAIDLPDANVLIQISGTFGSRQEEAQRLGRILRPKENGSQAYFYSLVTRDTREQEFAMNRQLFLAEQGYQYQIKNWENH